MAWIDDVAISCLDSENGDFLFLPWPGSYMDQPYTSLNVLRLIQSYYKQMKNEARKAMMKR